MKTALFIRTLRCWLLKPHILIQQYTHIHSTSIYSIPYCRNYTGCWPEATSAAALIIMLTSLISKSTLLSSEVLVLGLCKLHFCFVCWLCIGSWQSGALVGVSKSGREEGNFSFLFVPSGASFLLLIPGSIMQANFFTLQCLSVSTAESL